VLQLFGRQCQNTVLCHHKADIGHFLAVGVKQVAKGAMIRFHTALVCQEHVAHEYSDRNMISLKIVNGVERSEIPVTIVLN